MGQSVTVGAYQQPFTSDGSQAATVIEQRFSPGYNFGGSNLTPNVLKNDFMLLRLDRDIVLHDYMRLSNYEEDMEPGVITTAIGFGLLAPLPSTQQPEFLQEAMQSVWFDGDCEIVYSSRTPPLFVDGNVEVCVGGRTTMEVANVSLICTNLLLTQKIFVSLALIHILLICFPFCYRVILEGLCLEWLEGPTTRLELCHGRNLTRLILGFQM